MMLGPVNVTQTYTSGPAKGERAEDLQVGAWSVGREDDLIDPKNPDDEVHTYNWAVSVKQRSGQINQYTGKLSHRYGDGWVVLLMKVFEAAEAEEMKQDKKRAGTGSRLELVGDE